MALEHRIKNALDEGRMVVLVVQVVLGFQFRAVWEPGFGRLGPTSRLGHVAALGLLLAAFAIAVSPAAFHRLAAGGEDSPRVLRVTARAVTLAMLPFALALAFNLGVVSRLLVARVVAFGLAATAGLLAVAWWYIVPLLQRQPARPERDEAGGPIALDAKVDQTLTEARMVLPGAQALLGFQFATFFAERFLALPRVFQMIHLAALGCVALATILLIGTAAHHRLAEHGNATERFYRYASRLVESSLVALAFGMATDLYVVVTTVFHSPSAGMVASGVSLIAMCALWFAFPLAARHSRVA
jgi:hypothetical protein